MSKNQELEEKLNTFSKEHNIPIERVNELYEWVNHSYFLTVKEYPLKKQWEGQKYGPDHGSSGGTRSILKQSTERFETREDAEKAINDLQEGETNDGFIIESGITRHIFSLLRKLK